MDHLAQHFENIVYLIAASLFIFGLKQLGSPRTAPRGNMLAGVGMLLAIIAVIIGTDTGDTNLFLILGAMIVGSAIGAFAAQTVKMTAMPQMVALFNGFGGAASSFVAGSEYSTYVADPGATITIPVVLSTLIGTLTLTGSLLAFGKLQGLVTGQPVTFPFQKTVNAALFSYDDRPVGVSLSRIRRPRVRSSP